MADDHELARIGLKAVINRQRDMRVTAEASSGHEMLQLISKTPNYWSVVLLDLVMPGSNGIQNIKAIRRLNSSLPILVVSGFSERQFGLEILAAGARGFFSKAHHFKELPDVIRGLSGGAKYVSRELAIALT